MFSKEEKQLENKLMSLIKGDFKEWLSPFGGKPPTPPTDIFVWLAHRHEQAYKEAKDLGLDNDALVRLVGRAAFRAGVANYTPLGEWREGWSSEKEEGLNTEVNPVALQEKLTAFLEEDNGHDAFETLTDLGRNRTREDLCFFDILRLGVLLAKDPETRNEILMSEVDDSVGGKKNANAILGRALEAAGVIVFDEETGDVHPNCDIEEAD